MTNLSWNVDDILPKLNSSKIIEIVPSYHPEFCELDELITKIKKIKERGIYVNLGVVDFPEQKDKIDAAIEKFAQNNITVRREVFLGWKDGELYPKNDEDLKKCHIGVDYLKLYEMCGGRNTKAVRCRQQKILFAENIYN